MRIFISHAFDNEDLATKLKGILEKHDKIDEAYMAQRSPNFELEISEKIVREIKNSDYLVVIVTKITISRPSVHQELGFAQGLGIHKIPLIEKNARKGVFLEGRDSFTFETDQFENSCNQVLDYIIQHGPTRKKFTRDEEEFVQKSAHFRYVVECELIQFMSGILVYFQIDQNEERLFFDEKGREKARSLLIDFINDKDGMYQKIKNLQLRNLIKINSDYDLLRRGLEDAKRFPSSELFNDEQDALLRLTDRVLEISDYNINVEKQLKDTLQSQLINYDTTYQTLIKEHPELVTLPNNLGAYVLYIQILIRSVIGLDKVFVRLRKKFGDLAFKDTYDSDFA